MTKVFLLTYFAFYLKDMVSKDRTVITYANIKRDLSNEDFKVHLTKDNFDVAAALFYTGSDPSI